MLFDHLHDGREREAAIAALIKEAEEEGKRSSPEEAARKLVEKINEMRGDSQTPPHYIVLEERHKWLSEQHPVLPLKKKKKKVPIHSLFLSFTLILYLSVMNNKHFFFRWII